MRKLFVGACVLALAVSFLATASFASNNGNAKMAIHVQAHVVKNNCTAAGLPATCSAIVPYVASAGGALYDAYVCIYDFDDMCGTQFGIDYIGGYDPTPGSIVNGLAVWSWTLCLAGLNALTIPSSTPAWPGPGSGMAIAHDPVRPAFSPGGNNAVTVLGYLYLTAYGTGGRLSIVTDARMSHVQIGDCGPKETPPRASYLHNIDGNTPSSLGYADFGSTGGYTPGCGNVATQEGTWGKIKSLYR